MKGQMSEAELHFIRARLRGGILSKARRGELDLPRCRSGWPTTPRGTSHPRPRHRRPGCRRAPVRHLRRDRVSHRCVNGVQPPAGLPFPWRHRAGPHKGEIDWKPLAHHVVLRILHNPLYAGAFTFGRHRDITFPGGKLSRTTLPPREEWIHPSSPRPPRIHHPGSVRREPRPADHQRRRARPRPGRRATPRRPRAAAGHHHLRDPCGQRMTVRYHQRRESSKSPPTCASATASNMPAGSARPSPAPDSTQRIGQLLIETRPRSPRPPRSRPYRPGPELQHRADEAGALRAAHAQCSRYHADLARRRYLAVDPANRLVADTLEADWNTALRALRHPGAGRLRAGPQAGHRAAHRRPENPDPPAGHRPARDLERPRHPSPRKKAHRPAAAHRRHRHPDPEHHHRARPPAPQASTTPSPFPYRQPPPRCAKPPPPRSPPSMSSSTTTPTPRSPASSTTAA